MRSERIISWSFIAVLSGVVLILLLRGCGIKPNGTEVVSDTVIVYQDKIREFPVKVPVLSKEYIPVPYEVVKYITDSGRIDSVKCLQLAMAYYAQREYADTSENDTIKITTKVWGNRVDSVQSSYLIKTPFTTIVNQYQPKRKVQVFLGGQVGLSVPVIGQSEPPTQLILGPSILFKDRRDRLYFLNPGLSTSGELYIQAGVAFKISFKK